MDLHIYGSAITGGSCVWHIGQRSIDLTSTKANFPLVYTYWQRKGQDALTHMLLQDPKARQYCMDRPFVVSSLILTLPLTVQQKCPYATLFGCQRDKSDTGSGVHSQWQCNGTSCSITEMFCISDFKWKQCLLWTKMCGSQSGAPSGMIVDSVFAAEKHGILRVCEDTIHMKELDSILGH